MSGASIGANAVRTHRVVNQVCQIEEISIRISDSAVDRVGLGLAHKRRLPFENIRAVILLLQEGRTLN